MTLQTLAKYLNTDDLWLSGKDDFGFAHYEGKEALEEAVSRHGWRKVIKITPGDNCLDITIA
jgi:hypothetical protein